MTALNDIIMQILCNHKGAMSTLYDAEGTPVAEMCKRCNMLWIKDQDLQNKLRTETQNK